MLLEVDSSYMKSDKQHEEEVSNFTVSNKKENNKGDGERHLTCKFTQILF